MDRRLYFLIPDVMHAERLERQLIENGVSRRNMHAVARESVAINHLPKSSELQQHDIANKVESWLWVAGPDRCHGPPSRPAPPLALWLDPGEPPGAFGLHRCRPTLDP